MKIKKHKLVNCFQHTDTDIDFTGGLIGVIGANGSGKSNFVRTIGFNVTGDFSTKKELCITSGEKSGSIQTVIGINPSLDITITRHLNGNKAELSFSDGRPSINGADAVNQAILDILCVDKSTLKNIVFVGQKELGDLLYSRDAERERLAQQFFGVNEANRIEKILADKQNSLMMFSVSDNIKELEDQIAQCSSSLNGIAEKLAELDLNSMQSEKKTLEDELRRYNNAAHKAAEYKEAQKTLAKLNASIREKHVEILSLKSSISGLDLKKIEARLEEEKKKRRAFIAREEINKKLIIKQDEYVNLTPHTSESVIQSKQEELKKLKDIQLADATIPALQESIIDEVDEHGSMPCPVCFGVINPRSLPAMEKEVEAFKASKEKYSGIGALESQIADLQKMHRSYQSAFEKLTVELRELYLRKDAEEAICGGNDGEVEKWKANFDFVQSVSIRIDNAESVLCSLTDHRDSLPSTPPPEIEDVQFSVDMAEHAIGILQTNIALAQDLLIDKAKLETAILHHSETIASKKEALEMNDKIVERRNKIGELRRAFSPDGLPHILVSRRAARMVEKINEYLGILKVPFTIESIGGFNFEAIFPNKPTTISIKELSGGQKDDLSLAFRFAACEAFNSTVGVLVLDEPTSALDADTKHHFTTLLERLKDMSMDLDMQFITITHDRQFIGAFDQVIEF